jgi:hypothetical protein
MKRLLLLLCLACPTWANTLSLEFAQEGDPGQPRALIVIHNINESRESLKPFFTAWANGSWGRDQFCSVYSYEYDGNGPNTLTASETLSQDLYARIASDNVEDGRPDTINPHRRVQPTDARQPSPRLSNSNLQLILAGSGYGGLVARRVCLLAKHEQRQVPRMAYIGTPLDGLSTIDLILGVTIPERAALLGLERPIEPANLSLLSPAWWSLPELFDPLKEWSTVFAPAYQDVKMVAAYGALAVPAHPTDNVLLGRYRPAVYGSDTSHDGFLPSPVAWGRGTGPISWLSETTQAKTSHANLTESSAEFVLKQALDRPVIYGYLATRYNIEEYFRGKLGEPPLYHYWDERDSDGLTAQMRPAYASPKGLYEMMWGVGP